jgi:FkbM family methyltransferase
LDPSLKWVPAHPTGKLFKWYLLLPNHPSKIRVENWLGSLFFKKGILLEGYGAKLQLDANDWITRNLIEEGHFENLSLQRARHILQNGGNFLDIGANFGLYTNVLGNLPGVKCLCVDASPAMINMLKINLSLNPAVKASIVGTALGPTYGKVKFFCPNKGNAGTSKTVHPGEEVEGEYEVIDCMPLNDLLAQQDFRPIQLLKIDIEGFEMEVLRSFDFNGKYRPANIIMEYIPTLHSDGFRFGEIKHFFESRGYELLNVSGEKLKSEAQIEEDNIWLKEKAR